MRNEREKEKGKLTPRVRLSHGHRRAELHAAHGYFSFLYHAFPHTSTYMLFRRFHAVFAPTLWIGRVLRFLFRAVTVLETGTFLLLLSVLFLLLLPVLLLLATAFAFRAARERRRENTRLAPLFRGARVLSFFPAQRTPFAEGAWASLAERYTVVLVTDFFSEFAGGQGISPLRPAFLRADGVLLVREHYYFYLRRTLLRESAFFAAIF